MILIPLLRGEALDMEEDELGLGDELIKFLPLDLAGVEQLMTVGVFSSFIKSELQDLLRSWPDISAVLMCLWMTVAAERMVSRVMTPFSCMMFRWDTKFLYKFSWVMVSFWSLVNFIVIRSMCLMPETV